jgi:hypothetical protein
MTTIPENFAAMRAQIEAAWLSRAAAQQLGKPSSARYSKAEAEFFVGAMAALNAAFPNPEGADKLSTAVPVAWVIHMMSGRNVVEVPR